VVHLIKNLHTTAFTRKKSGGVIRSVKNIVQPVRKNNVHDSGGAMDNFMERVVRSALDMRHPGRKRQSAGVNLKLNRLSINAFNRFSGGFGA
jgi:hypothetical protein